MKSEILRTGTEEKGDKGGSAERTDRPASLLALKYTTVVKLTRGSALQMLTEHRVEKQVGTKEGLKVHRKPGTGYYVKILKLFMDGRIVGNVTYAALYFLITYKCSPISIFSDENGGVGTTKGIKGVKERGRRDSTQTRHETYETALGAMELIYKKGYHFSKDLKKRKTKL